MRPSISVRGDTDTMNGFPDAFLLSFKLAVVNQLTTFSDVVDTTA